MIYTASSLALAALEMLVHLPPSMRRKGGFPHLIVVGLDVPDDLVTEFDVALLAPGYGIPDCRSAGDAWISGDNSLGLKVPSQLIRQEVNVLLNPAHKAMAEVQIKVQQAFHFDDRLGL